MPARSKSFLEAADRVVVGGEYPAIDGGVAVAAEGIENEEVCRLVWGEGVPPERTVWLGFSQGACLVTEWVARHPARWGGLVALTGGHIGPPGPIRSIAGAFEGMPAYFGVAIGDEWVPLERVQESASMFARAGAHVHLEIFPSDRHEIRPDETAAAGRIIGALGA